MADVTKVRLTDEVAALRDAWQPRIVGEVNDCCLKVVKLRGEFMWHHHDTEDELFLVTSGELRMRLHGGDVELEPGELVVVPHGVEHCPETITDEVEVLLFEPSTTRNTGTVVNERTYEPDRA